MALPLLVPARRSASLASPSVVLFLTLFASQAGVLVLSPMLAQVADDLGVSIAEAGQLRVIAAPLAAVVAVGTGRALGRFSPRAMIGAGSALLAVGSVASAAAPSFLLLALAQVPMWCGIAVLLASGIAATAAWTEEDDRTRVVSHALAGPPSAWIVGMPLIGVVSVASWRLAFIALTLPAAVLAGIAAWRRPADAPVAGASGSILGLLGRPVARRWALGELLANCAWAGTLVYSGALFTERFGLSSAATGGALALVAVAYLAGNRLGGRTTQAGARRTMLSMSIVAAGAVALTWALTQSVVATLVLFGATSVATAWRTVAGTVYGFLVAEEHARHVGAVRAATTQVGYLVGSALGGAAIAIGGLGLLSVVFGGLFVASTLPYACVRARGTAAAAPAPG